jgi:hypothetical protein
MWSPNQIKLVVKAKKYGTLMNKIIKKKLFSLKKIETKQK